MPAALSAYGTLFQFGNNDGPPETFTTMGEVTDIQGPGIKLANKKVTSHSSPGAVDQYIPTLIDMGTVTISFNRLPTDPTHDFTHTRAAGTLLMNRTAFNFRIIWIDGGAGTTWQFPGIMTDYKPGAKAEDINTGQITVQITGQATTLV